MKFYLTFFACLFCLLPSLKSSPLIQALEDSTVIVQGPRGTGTGNLFIREGDTYVLTAAHVVEEARVVHIVPDNETHTIRVYVEFKDVVVSKYVSENGKLVGMKTVFAEIVKYSDKEQGDDIAVLKLRVNGVIHPVNTEFALDGALPPIGTMLYHFGNFHGVFTDSFSSGVYSQYNRILGTKVFDQCGVGIVSGSSGGGVFLTNGKYIGMAVRGVPQEEMLGFITPIRRLLEWAKNNNCMWVFDPRIKVNKTAVIENYLEAADIE